METTKLTMNRKQISAMLAVIQLEAMQIFTHGIIRAVKESKSEAEYLTLTLGHIMKNIDQWNQLTRPFDFALGQFEDNGRDGEGLEVIVPTMDITLYANLLKKGSFNIALEALTDEEAPEEIRENKTVRLISAHVKELIAIFGVGVDKEELKEDKRFMPLWAQKSPPKDMLN